MSNRIFGWAMEYLYFHGPKNTRQITDYIKDEKSKFGVSSRKLVNIMGNDKTVFLDIGKDVIVADYGSYEVSLWDVNRKNVDEKAIRSMHSERCNARKRAKKRRLFD